MEELNPASADSGEAIDAAGAAIERIFDRISSDTRCQLVAEALLDAYRNGAWTAEGIGRKLAGVSSTAAVGVAEESGE